MTVLFQGWRRYIERHREIDYLQAFIKSVSSRTGHHQKGAVELTVTKATKAELSSKPVCFMKQHSSSPTGRIRCYMRLLRTCRMALSTPILTWLGCLCLVQIALPLVLASAVPTSSQRLGCNTASIWAHQLQEGPSLFLQCGWQ